MKRSWGLLGLAAVAVLAYVVYTRSPVVNGCLKSQYYCPGVGCVSGPDKCVPGSFGGASAIFSRETFVSKSCPDKTRSDGPCLMEF
jgi:hypothetical protein